MAIGGSQWLGHHDLEAKHQQLFQEPKHFFQINANSANLVTKQIIYFIQKICFGGYSCGITRMFHK